MTKFAASDAEPHICRHCSREGGEHIINFDHPDAGLRCPVSKPADAVNHPAHYTQGGIECIDALESATTDLTGIEAVCTASAIKYLWRWKTKGGLEDLKKARWYINRLLGEK